MDRTLLELEIINRFLGGNAVTIGALQKLTAGNPGKDLSIADLGCGRADMLRLIYKWSVQNNRRVLLTGIDANPYIINAARENLTEFPEVELSSMNIFSEEFRQREFDVVIGTLFYHHFTNAELIQFFSHLKTRTKIGFIINDIHRHPLAYYSIKLLTILFSRSSMVQYDAPLSVLRAFRKSEIIHILKQAGLSRFEVKWRWAFRWQVIARTDVL
ncbi:MAG: methyltransferase domain-containing protein [Chryseolinea sp.]